MRHSCIELPFLLFPSSAAADNHQVSMGLSATLSERAVGLSPQELMCKVPNTQCAVVPVDLAMCFAGSLEKQGPR